MFKTNQGTNFLDSYSKSMEKFKNAMSRSQKSGFIFDFSDAVKGFALSDDKIETFKKVLKTFMQMMGAFAPVVQTMSNAFTSIFVPSIEMAMKQFAAFLSVVHSMNIDAISGKIIGFIAAFKLLPTILGPAINALKVFGGAFLALKSTKGVVDAVTTGMLKISYWLEKIPVVGGKASSSLMNVSKSIEGFAGKFGAIVGPITLAIAAIAAMIFTIRGANNDFKEFNNQLDTNAEHSKQAAKSLNEAFLADNGKIGKTVLDQLSTNMTQKMQDLEDTAAKGPGLLAHIGKWLTTSANDSRWYTKESDSTNKWQKEAADADRAAKKLRELRQKNIDLEEVVSSSSATYAEWIQKLRQSGDGGNEAANVLDNQRKQFQLYYESMSRIGPAGVMVANGIKKIAEAGGDAASKLDGLKMALEGLGFLKVDALQAAADYTTALGSFATDVQQAIADSGGDVSQAFNKVNGSLNTSSQLGANLVSIFGRISNAFLTTANNGGNIDEAMARLKDQIATIAPSLGTTAEKLQSMLANSFGIVPEPIKLLLQLDGKDEVTQKLGQLLLQLDAYAKDNSVKVAIHFASEEGAKLLDQEIEKALGRDITDVNGTDVVLKVGIAPPSPEEMAKLQATLASHGIQTAPGTFATPATMPVTPIPVQSAPVGPAAPIPAPPVQAPKPTFTPNPYAPAPTQTGTRAYPAVQFGPTPTAAPAAPPVAMPQMPDITPKLDEASKKVDEVQGKMQSLVSNKNNIIELNSDKIDDAKRKVDDVSQFLVSHKMKADIEIDDSKLESANQSVNKIVESTTNVFNTLKDQISQIVENIGGKTAEISDGVSKELDNLIAVAASAGSKFVDAFANGLKNNPMAINEARNMAAAVKDQFHQSPPKEGPLAAHGDAAVYAGKQFVKSYAEGLSSALPVASKAAGSVAGVAGSAVSGGGPGAAAGQFLGQFLQLTNFASAINDIFKRVSDTVMQAMKYISDPKGDGSFFGKMRYQKTVSNEQLQKRENDRLNQAYLGMMSGGQRNNDVFNQRLDIIRNAQNAVVDQPGYKSGEAAQTVGAALKAAFPQLADATIGGARPDALPYHRDGRAIDVMIPNWNTKEGKALGDQINAWALQNAKKLGIEDTIWQDFWQPGNGGQGNFLGRMNQGPDAAHLTHVHITFSPGAQVDLTGLQFTPQEAQQYRDQAAIEDRKKALQKLQDQYGPPLEPGAKLDSTPTQLQWDESTKSFKMVTPHGTKDIPSLGPINPETQKPWTDAERQKYIQENPMQYTLPDGFTQAQMDAVANNPGEFSQQNAEDILKELASTNADVAEAMKIRDNPGDFASFDPNRVTQILETLDQMMIDNKATDTAGSRIKGGALESLKSSVLDNSGFSQSANPIDTVGTVVSQASGLASDVINTVVTGIETVGAVKNITDTLVRGVANTEDIYKNIDNVQKIFELFAGIAGSVGSVAGLAASITGAAGSGDPSGGTAAASAALGAVGMIAGFVQSAWEITNALIDLGQEVYRVAGTYVGEFLGYLVGGPGGPLQGNVKFLLDQQANQLLSYAVDNPMDKRTFNIPGTQPNDSARQQLIGNINVYGGPGSDPRDMTRQMMFQVNAAQYAGALAQ